MWETNTSLSDFDAKGFAERAGDGRTYSDPASYTATMNVVGMNASKVGNTREVIRQSVANIQAEIDKVGTENGNATNSDAAYRSPAVKAAVDTYIANVKAYCNALVSNLLAFSDKLADVQRAWEESSTAMADVVGTASSGMESGTNAYVEQFATAGPDVPAEGATTEGEPVPPAQETPAPEAPATE